VKTQFPIQYPDIIHGLNQEWYRDTYLYICAIANFLNFVNYLANQVRFSTKERVAFKPFEQ